MLSILSRYPEEATLNDYNWSFGDGTTTSGDDVTHTFNTAGSFKSLFTVTDSYGNRSSQLPITIQVDDAVTPVIQADRTVGVAPLSVYFSASETAGLSQGDYVNAQFNWNFDKYGTNPNADYTVASGFNAAHVFEEPGIYTVEVEAVDMAGEIAFSEVTIEVLDFHADPSSVTYYFSTTGNDSNPGTIDSPKRTLAHAVSLLGPHVEVLLRKGTSGNTLKRQFGKLKAPQYWGLMKTRMH